MAQLLSWHLSPTSSPDAGLLFQPQAPSPPFAAEEESRNLQATERSSLLLLLLLPHHMKRKGCQKALRGKIYLFPFQNNVFFLCGKVQTRLQLQNKRFILLESTVSRISVLLKWLCVICRTASSIDIWVSAPLSQNSGTFEKSSGMTVTPLQTRAQKQQ